MIKINKTSAFYNEELEKEEINEDTKNMPDVTPAELFLMDKVKETPSLENIFIKAEIAEEEKQRAAILDIRQSLNQRELVKQDIDILAQNAEQEKIKIETENNQKSTANEKINEEIVFKANQESFLQEDSPAKEEFPEKINETKPTQQYYTNLRGGCLFNLTDIINSEPLKIPDKEISTNEKAQGTAEIKPQRLPFHTIELKDLIKD